MIRYWLAAILFTLVLGASAQLFKGQVLDEVTHEPIPFATVTLPDTHDGVLTDPNGFFTIERHPREIIRMQISSVGYKTLIITVDVSIDKESTFYLSESHLELNELIVSVPSGKLSDENIMQIERKQMSEMAGDQTISLANALASIPGVDQISTGQGIGKPVIRGLSGNRIVTYTQGIRLENQQFGDEHGVGENAVGIDRIEIIKGPASLLYGADALGGVLYLVPATYAPQNSLEGFVSSKVVSHSLSSLNAVGLKLNKSGIKWNVFGAYNSNTDYSIPGGERVSNTRFDEASFKTSIGFDRNNWVTNVRYSYLKNDFGIPEGALTNSTLRSPLLPFQNINQHLASWETIYYLNRTELSAVFGYTVNDREEYDETESAPVLDMNLSTATYNLKGIVPIGKKNRLMVGLQGMRRENKNSGQEILIPDATTKDIGGYSIINIDATEGWDFQGGVRLDHREIATVAFTDIDKSIPALDRTFSNLNFSAGSIFQRGRYTLRLNLASGFRPPNTAELLSEGIHEGTLRYERGNKNLKSEQGVQSDLSVEITSEHLTFTINPFYNAIRNFIVLAPTGEVIDGTDVFSYGQLDAALYGGEAGIHLHPHSIHWLHLSSNYSGVFAQDASGSPLPLIPANKIISRFSAEFDSDSKNRTIAMYVEHLHKFQQHRVAELETPSSAYHLFSAGASYDNKQTKVELGVNNLFNVTYIDHLSRLKREGIANQGRSLYVGVTKNF